MTTCTKGSGLARALAALVLTFAVVAAGHAFAKDKDGGWQVDGQLIGKKKGKKTKDTKDASGIACATDKGFPRTCLFIDDDLQAAQIVTLTDHKIKAGDPVPLIDNRLDGEPVSLDGEGVAFADGYFYVIGSHGLPRSEVETKTPEKEAAERLRAAAGLAASSQIIRLKYDAATGTIKSKGGKVSSIGLRKLIDREKLFTCYLALPLEKNGITIEGVAVLGGRLFAGFRGPVVGEGSDQRAVIMSAKLGYFFDDTSFEPKAADAKLYMLNLGKDRGVRDLAVYDDGMFILAGPVTSNKGIYSVYWWDGRGNEAKHLADLHKYTNGKEGDKEKQYKPEALLPLDRDAKEVRVLLLLDSAKEGDPQEVRVPYP